MKTKSTFRLGGILTIVLPLLSSSVSFSQTTAPGNQLIIPVPISSSQTENAILSLPDDYQSTTKKYPLLVFLHGAGEGVNNPSAIYNSSSAGGPSYFIAHSQWPSSFINPSDGLPYKFIVVSPQNTTGWSTSAPQLNYVLDYLVNNYRADTSRIYLTGLSAGGQGIVYYTTHNGVTPIYKPAAFVPMSAATTSPTQAWANTIVADSVRTWAFGSDPADVFGIYVHNLVNYLNTAKAGYGRFTNYSGGHCCWNQFYNPSYTENVNGTTMNIYQWMLMYTRPGNSIPLVSNAGNDIVLNLPANSVTLNGNNSSGSITSYKWTQVSGPSTATISNATNISTLVAGLVDGTYVFRLTVTSSSSSATDDIQVIVNTPPVASAGPDTTVVLPSSANLNGTGSSDPDGNIVSYSWNKISGPTQISILNTNNAVANISNLTAGLYTFRLTVTDNNGATSSADVNVLSTYAILPLQFISFQGNNTNGNNYLTWETVNNPATGYFEVQQSNDGIVYNNIGKVNMKQGISEKESYSFVDQYASVGMSYYRIMFVGSDLENKYSASISISNKQNHAGLRYYPNPVKDNLNIEIQSDKNGQVSLHIISASGRLVLSREWAKSSATLKESIDLGKIAKGVYFMEVYINGESFQRYKVIKE